MEKNRRARQRASKETLKNRDYQILLYGEIIGGDPDLFPFWHSSQTDYPGLNLSLFSNRDADKLLEEARSETAPDKREEMYKKFQELLVKELPAIFLYTPSHVMAMDKKIKGVQMERITRPSDRYNGLNDWYVKTKWTWKR